MLILRTGRKGKIFTVRKLADLNGRRKTVTRQINHVRNPQDSLYILSCTQSGCIGVAKFISWGWHRLGRLLAPLPIFGALLLEYFRRG